MDQQIDEAIKQLEGPTGRKGFVPGRSGNPKGMGLVNERIVACAAELVAHFQQIHGRKPTPNELSRIKSAAGFRIDSGRRALPLEDRVKCGNLAERIERKLGIDRPVRKSALAASLPSSPELLKGVK